MVKHVSEGWSCTGAEMLYHPRNRALLLSFLADGNLHQAVGAALAQVPGPGIVDTGDRMDEVIIDLLTALELDWEQVAFGSLVPVPCTNLANGRPVIYSIPSLESWSLLAARGSERAVRQCLELIAREKLDPGSAGEFLSAALGPAPDGKVERPFLPNQPVRSVKLAKEIRGEVLSVITGYLAPTNSPVDLVAMLDSVPSYSVKDLREPLTALIAHRRAGNALWQIQGTHRIHPRVRGDRKEDAKPAGQIPRGDSPCSMGAGFCDRCVHAGGAGSRRD